MQHFAKLCNEPKAQGALIKMGGIGTGVLRGVCPLQGVTGAKRKREGGDPLTGGDKLGLSPTSDPTPPARYQRPVKSKKSLISTRHTQYMSGIQMGVFAK